MRMLKASQFVYGRCDVEKVVKKSLRLYLKKTTYLM